MSKVNTIVSVASWEKRFLEGFSRNLKSYNPDSALILYYEEYASITENNRKEVKNLCTEDQQIVYNEIEITFESPPVTWKTLDKEFSNEAWENKNVLLDISTAPREAIWTTLHLLQGSKANIQYVYHRPKSYNQDWLSRDPGEPRLIYRQSGIMEPGKPTCLVIITGFDPERTEQLINYFEPQITCLAIQSGNQYENHRKNIDKHNAAIKAYANVELFDIDAFSIDHGYGDLSKCVSTMLKSHNIIMTSLGPKTSAIALYRLAQEHREIGLVYTPSREFNPDYSSGIGESLQGSL